MSVARLVREHLINQQVPIRIVAVSIKSIKVYPKYITISLVIFV
jgi:hypothetical protein